MKIPKEMIDVCGGGTMDTRGIQREIVHIIHVWNPERLIVDAKKIPNGYRATFWISPENFGKRRK